MTKRNKKGRERERERRWREQVRERMTIATDDTPHSL